MNPWTILKNTWINANLLDTHTFIWFVIGDDQLSIKARKSIESGTNYLSIASLWEIAIKVNLGKLKLNVPYEEIITQIAENNFQILPITFEDTLRVSTLQLHHGDPFDRILIAQSMNNKLSIISKDINFSQYNIDLIW